MELRQLDIFTDSPKEELTAPYNKGAGNQQILEENREHFNGQAKKVLDHLLKGERVSGLRMMELYKIQDIRPRIAAIKKAGYQLKEEKISGGHGAKEWFIENND